MGIKIPAPASTTSSLGGLNKRKPPKARLALQSRRCVRGALGMVGVLCVPFPFPPLLPPSASPHPCVCAAGSRCCMPTATWTGRSSGRCLTAPCTIGCGNSSAARTPSLRSMTRSARLPGTEPEPTRKEADARADPVPRARRHLPFTQAWLLCQIHTFRKKPLQKPHPDGPDSLLPDFRGSQVEWKGHEIWSQTNPSLVPSSATHLAV